MRLLGNFDLATSIDNMANTELAKDEDLYKKHKQVLLEREASVFKWFLIAAEKGDVSSMRQLSTQDDFIRHNYKVTAYRTLRRF